MGRASREISTQEVARLEALRRLALGGVHSLNNAFAAAVGEASFLREDRKHDPVVVEACDAILGSLDRCARITRALLSRRHPTQAGSEDVDLGRLLRELGSFLQETLGRGHSLRLDLPEDLLVVRGSPESVELALLTLVHHVAEAGGAMTRLHISAESGGAEVRIRLEAETAAPAAPIAEALRNPSLASDVMTSVCLDAFGSLLHELDGCYEARATAPKALAVCVRLPSGK